MHCLPPRKRGESANLIFLWHALAHHVVDIGRREIVGDEIGAGRLRRRRVDAPLQNRRQRVAEAVAFLQRGGAAGERPAFGPGRSGRDRDHLALVPVG